LRSSTIRSASLARREPRRRRTNSAQRIEAIGMKPQPSNRKGTADRRQDRTREADRFQARGGGNKSMRFIGVIVGVAVRDSNPDDSALKEQVSCVVSVLL
jgi:hypothetical protein